MKKAQIIAIGFIGLGLLDSLITFAFPIDFTYVHYSFVPQIGRASCRERVSLQV